MRRSTLLVFLAGSLALQACPKTSTESSGTTAATPPPAEEYGEAVTFSDAPPAAGVRIRTSDKLLMALDMRGTIGDMQPVFEGRMAKSELSASEQVLLIDTEQERVLEIRYDEDWVQEGEAAPTGAIKGEDGRVDPNVVADFQPVHQPTSGRSYTVRWTPDGGSEVSYSEAAEPAEASGEASEPAATPSEEETEQVLDDTSELLEREGGDADGLDDVLDGKTLRVGESMTLSGEEMAGILGEPDDEVEFQDLVLTLRAVEERGGVRCAVMDFTVQGRMADGALKGQMDLQGEFVASVDGMDLHRMEMWGDIAMGGIQAAEGMEISIMGKGAVHGLLVASYESDAPTPASEEPAEAPAEESKEEPASGGGE